MNKLAVAKLPTKGCSSAPLDGVSEPNKRFTLKQYTNPPWHGVFAVKTQIGDHVKCSPHANRLRQSNRTGIHDGCGCSWQRAASWF